MAERTPSHGASRACRPAKWTARKRQWLARRSLRSRLPYPTCPTHPRGMGRHGLADPWTAPQGTIFARPSIPRFPCSWTWATTVGSPCSPPKAPMPWDCFLNGLTGDLFASPSHAPRRSYASHTVTRAAASTRRQPRLARPACLWRTPVPRPYTGSQMSLRAWWTAPHRRRLRSLIGHGRSVGHSLRGLRDYVTRAGC